MNGRSWESDSCGASTCRGEQKGGGRLDGEPADDMAGRFINGSHTITSSKSRCFDLPPARPEPVHRVSLFRSHPYCHPVALSAQDLPFDGAVHDPLPLWQHLHSTDCWTNSTEYWRTVNVGFPASRLRAPGHLVLRVFRWHPAHFAGQIYISLLRIGAPFGQRHHCIHWDRHRREFHPRGLEAYPAHQMCYDPLSASNPAPENSTWGRWVAVAVQQPRSMLSSVGIAPCQIEQTAFVPPSC